MVIIKLLILENTTYMFVYTKTSLKYILHYHRFLTITSPKGQCKYKPEPVRMKAKGV